MLLPEPIVKRHIGSPHYKCTMRGANTTILLAERVYMYLRVSWCTSHACDMLVLLLLLRGLRRRVYSLLAAN